MEQTGSVSCWLGGLKAGDSGAAQEIWERFYERMLRLARTKLKDTPRNVRDEEDVAVSAFHQLCKAAREGRFPRLDDRDDLWKLLVHLTENKARDYGRHERRAKRDRFHADLQAWTGLRGTLESGSSFQPIDQAPAPDFVASLKDLLGHLLGKLPEEKQRSIAVLKLEGWTNADIARQLGCPLRTVERKLSVIRALWREGLAP